MDKVFCRACGNEILSSAEICPSCGTRQKTGAGGRSRIAAALLAFFLGGLGAHKFYMGKPGLGVLYILFCWTLIPSLIAFIEFIIYLYESDEKFEQRVAA